MSLLAASMQGLQDQYDILGEFGRADDGALAYLARDRTTEELVALRVEAQSPDGQPPKVTVAPALNSSVPANNRSCLICKALIHDWRRFCADCGADLSGVEVRADAAEARQLLDRVVQASQKNLEIIGQVRRSEGGGAVYFGLERETNRIVALDLQRSEAEKGPAAAYSLNVTSTLERTQIYDPAALSVKLPAVPPTADLPVTRPQPDAGKVCPSCGTEYDGRTRFCPNDGSVLRAKGSTEELIGEVIADRYHILEKIGQGGMGQVYLAEHVRMGRRCAIKVMKRSLSQDPGAVSRFAREAANASRINDHNVAHIYDFGESKEHGIYLAMEYVEGVVLSQILQREGALSIERSVRIAAQVAKALAAAHKEGVVHRDLTPNNIVVGNSADEVDLVKVVDFGIAKAMQDTGDGLTRTGFVVGTPRYMSPEQLIAEPVDGRSDLYSLGCILFEMLVGTHPFAGPDGAHNVAKRLTEPPPHPRQINRNIPTTIDTVVVKTLARTPPERYQNAHEFRQALEAAATQEATRKFSWRSRRRQAGSPDVPTAAPSQRPVTPSGGSAAATPVPYFTPSPFGATIAVEKHSSDETPIPSAQPDEIAAILTPAGGAPQQLAPAALFAVATTQPEPAPAAVVGQDRNARVRALRRDVADRSRIAVEALSVFWHWAMAFAQRAMRGTVRGATVTWRGVSADAVIVFTAMRRAGSVLGRRVRAAWPVVVRVTREHLSAAWRGMSAGSRGALTVGRRGVTAGIRGVNARSRVMVSARHHGIDAGLRGTSLARSSVSTWWHAVTTRWRIAGAVGVVAALAASVTAMLAGAEGPTARAQGTKTLPVALPAVVVPAPPPPEPVLGHVVFAIALPPGAEVRVDGETAVVQNDTLPLLPGDHVVEIAAAGFKPISKTVSVEAGLPLSWTEALQPDRPAPPVDPVSRAARPLPLVKAPVDANAEFVRSVTRELTMFRGFLQSNYLEAVRSTMTSREFDSLRTAIASAGNAPISVELGDIVVPDITATRATFILRIVSTSANKTLLASTPYIADFAPSNNTWILEFINRAAH